jgi:multiple sugar transport system substrate-binding protein
MQRSNSGISRRAFVGGGVSAATVAFLAACSSGSSAGSTSTAAKSGTIKTPITFADWQNSNTAVVDATAKYSAKTGVKVTFQAPVSYADYQTRFRAILSGNTPPDVVRCDDDFVAQFAAEGAFEDLNKYIKSSGFDSSSVVPALYKFPIQKKTGVHAAWVVGVQPRCIYYNKTMFQEKGVPLPPSTWTDKDWKWDDFLATAQKLTDASTGTYGAMVLNDIGFEQTFSVNNGGEGVFGADGKTFTLADKDGYEAMQFLADLTLKHQVQPPWGVIQQTNSAESLFVQQKLGMYFATSGEVPYLRANVKGFDWDIAPVPGQVKQMVEGSLIVYAVPSHSKKQAAAFQLLDYLAGEEAGNVYAGSSAFIPINKKAGTNMKPTAGTPPQNIPLFVDGAARQVSKNFTPATASAAAIYEPLMTQIWTGEKTAKEVLQGCKAKVEQTLTSGA